MRPFMSEETLMYSTMVEMLQSRANERPNQEAYRFLLDGELNEESMTFAELDRRARVIGAKLQHMQAGGERVLLLYQPGLEYIAAFFGCLYAGSIAVPAYPRLLLGSYRGFTPLLWIVRQKSHSRLQNWQRISKRALPRSRK